MNTSRPGIGTTAYEAIRAGKTNEEALAIVKEAFPDGRTQLHDINWYRTKLRRQGENIPTQGELKRMRANMKVADRDTYTYNRPMVNLAFDTYKFVKDLTSAGMKTEQAEVLATSYADLLTDKLATKDDILILRKDMEALEQRLDGKIDTLEQRLTGNIETLEQRLTGNMETLEQRLNARIAYAQIATIVILSAVIAFFSFYAT